MYLRKEAHSPGQAKHDNQARESDRQNSSPEEVGGY